MKLFAKWTTMLLLASGFIFALANGLTRPVLADDPIDWSKVDIPKPVPPEVGSQEIYPATAIDPDNPPPAGIPEFERASDFTGSNIVLVVSDFPFCNEFNGDYWTKWRNDRGISLDFVNSSSNNFWTCDSPPTGKQKHSMDDFFTLVGNLRNVKILFANIIYQTTIGGGGVTMPCKPVLSEDRCGIERIEVVANTTPAGAKVYLPLVVKR